MNELEQKILALEKEVLALKTATIKVSGQVKTEWHVSFWRLSLKLNGEVVVPKRLLKVNVIPRNGSPILTCATLEKFMQTSFEGRHIYSYKKIQPNNIVSFTFWVEGNAEDRSKLENGEDVELLMDVQACGTAAFRIELEEIPN